MKCEICNINELDNYCATNVCEDCCINGKCLMRYECKAYIEMLEKTKIKPIFKIGFAADELPDYCETCGREFGDIIIDGIYNREIETEEKYQKNYKKKLGKDFEKKLFNTFDKEGRQWLNLYIQKESSEYVVAKLISFMEKMRIENRIREYRRK